MRTALPLLLALFAIVSCQRNTSTVVDESVWAEMLMKTNKALTDIIIHDIFSPPQASRIYAYPNIAAYEVLIQHYPEYRSLTGQLNGFNGIPKYEGEGEIYYQAAALIAFTRVGRELVFGYDYMDEYEEELIVALNELKLDAAMLDRSIEYGRTVAKAMLQEYIRKDGYEETRGMSRYVVSHDPGHWKPTPPSYKDAIEPHWNLIRPFTLDSANQFMPEPPPPFSMDTNSAFYRDVMEVYQGTISLEVEQREIAAFWDCNPFVVYHQGHLMHGSKKISPGGHWMGIAAIACRQNGDDMMAASATMVLTSIALADAFIVCWDEKYRSNYIRPETAINRMIDHSWEPLLQTPPFPEYTSGHSTISTAASIALTHIYGDGFAFTDTVEVEFGLPVRSFGSFKEAAAEAAISRFYGGIHYMPAIEQGIEQGQKVGAIVLKKVQLQHD